MPHLDPQEDVNSTAMDDYFTDCITPPNAIPHTASEEYGIIQNQPGDILKESPMKCIAIRNSCKSHGRILTDNTLKSQEQQIHTISSSDEEFVIEKNTIEEEIANISSEENSDFEGFDDCSTPNSSSVINDISQENFNIYSNYLKRLSDIDFKEYHVHSESEEQAFEEAGSRDEEISIPDNDRIIYSTKGLISPKRAQKNRCDPCTPNKRKKYFKEEKDIAMSPTQLKTPPDQVVEVNSDSTTNSLKEKRQQINNKLQLNLFQQHHKANNNTNKCSTESTSEFPVSSPSNPQQARGGKYPARPPLLKNTLPADSFERQLAMITACNPQMTLAEKIQSWDFEEEPSDLEDVEMFDEEFKRMERQKIKQKEKSGRIKNIEHKNYDFLTFRQMILNNIKEQKKQKYTSGQGGGGAVGASGGKYIETSGSDSSKSVVHVDDRPSTSAIAQQQLQQRRSKHQLLFELGEPKKRVVKKSQKNQNSTTPPQTSSSDNERGCFKSAKNNMGQRQMHTFDTLLCASSSDEAISQEESTLMPLKLNNKYPQATLRNVRKKSPGGQQLPDSPAKSNEKNKLPKNCRAITDEEIQSFFRPHRINRERDKYSRSPITVIEEQSPSIIQMRLDFGNENKETILEEKNKEVFKTPIIPQRYLLNPLMTAEYQRQINYSPTKNEKTNEEIEADPLTALPMLKADNAKNEVFKEKLQTKSIVDDSDGVYHQQHEFCNYLGLTGMSTATAMANAVAELAQCNLARRSMRVLRQQQQERRDKSAKEERMLEALKLKQLKEIRKREKEGCDIIPVIESKRTIILKSEEGSNSQVSEPETSLNELKRKTSNNSTAKSSTKSRNSYTNAQKEQEIKILCHITAKNKEEAEKLSSECNKEIAQPIRETLMRHAKSRKSEKVNVHEIDTKVDGNKSKKADSVEKASSMDKEKATKSPKMPTDKSLVEEKSTAKILRSPIFPTDKHLLEKEYVTKVLRSPILSTDKNLLKNKRNGSQDIYEKNDTVQELETSIVCKYDPVGDSSSQSKSIEIKCARPSSSSKTDDLNMVDIFNEHSNAGINLISSAPSTIQKKLQLALEESRKSKPSIFIVQSLETKKEKLNNSNIKRAILAKNVEGAISLPYMYEGEEVHKDLQKSNKTSPNNYNKSDKKKVLKAPKGKKYPISKRKLRTRKIIVIKASKPKHKQYDSLNARELRSSPRINENQKQSAMVKKTEDFKQTSDKMPMCNESKSFRTVHTETKDLEIYLNKQNNQAKTRLMAKASALLERSRRMTLRGSCNLVNNNSKFTPKLQRRSKLNLRGTKKQNFKPNLSNKTTDGKKIRSTFKHKQFSSKKPKETKTIKTKANLSSTSILPESDNVVVSSTTSTYDEKPSYEVLATQSPITLRSLHNTASYAIASSPIKTTKDQESQCDTSYGVHYLNMPPLPIHPMRNPLKSEHGVVLYIYNELDILIVIQEHLVSFWKCSKLINMLITPNIAASCRTLGNCNNLLGQDAAFSSTINLQSECNEWIQLGELRRLNLDFEISVPYANRICLHNSTPIYLEMRAEELPKNHRECNLISMYINIYYYNDEDMIARCNSIPLDSIQSDIKSINYTTLTDSRYFIITWPQENILGKTRSGLCKYSLTPQLDTLASIREFKSMRHTIRYLECISDDKLIGFGETQVSIWDYRSGDVLMNFDFEIPMGRNLGSIYFSSQDIEQNNVLILHQLRDVYNNGKPELLTLACTVTHSQPSYKILQETMLPTPSFKVIKSAIKTGDHLVVAGQNDELWISLANPRVITVIPNMQNTTRFYSRERSQLIELTEKTLNVNSLANHILQLAAGILLN